ncbi:hypothetical protein HHJ44_20030 [Escherichia coli]|nr:hypothetical protein HHJ44_20030 [Escherichia coli]
MNVTRKPLASGKRKTRETRNDEATRLLLQYSQQQAQVWKDRLLLPDSQQVLLRKDVTEAHKQLLAPAAAHQRPTGKKKLTEDESVLARKDERPIQALTLVGCKTAGVL